MLAKVSIFPTSIQEEMLLSPYSMQYLSKHGRLPEDPETHGEHNDGCGIAFVKNNQLEIHRRDKDHSWDYTFRLIVENAKSNLFIAHNRKAYKDLTINEKRSHPFLYQTFAFCHNGGVYSFMDEALDHGITDTEIFFKELLDKAENKSSQGIFNSLNNIANTTDYSSLTGFLMNNQELFAWRIYNTKNKERAQRFEDYYTLWLKNNKGSVVIASEPLDNGNWEKLPNFSFIHLKPTPDRIDQFRKHITITR
ncbi:class II glutamine amidotransferase [Solitalea lacus]|uniref:class II glutamine amidotransferase n=1 Tax=Solitalea lacus TaxID=2911172 RepID=UPI001EDC510C|nr:class II glutamine amidotransferase [Solitalea lacus]UKJ05755.1 class II glutamine amidotransferase [Solitalea lacus]